MLARGFAACMVTVAMVNATGPLHAQLPGITLAEALRRADLANADLRIAQSEAVAAQGIARAARRPAFNPEVGAELGRLQETVDNRSTHALGLSQRFELGGKRGSRIRAEDQRSAAALARLGRRGNEVAARVTRAFSLAQIAKLRVATAREAEQVAVQLKTAADERLALGAGTLLEVNVAAAAMSRERRARLDAERSAATAVLELASSIGLPAAEAPEPLGELILPAPEARPESELIELALARRPDLHAAVADREAASWNLRFARGLAWPDPAFAATLGRDESRFLNFGITLALPLLNQAQGPRAQARGFFEQASILEASLRQEVAREVRDAYQAYARALEAHSAFDRDAVERLSENLRLAEESFRAGKIGLLVFSTVRRDLVEARLSYLDATADLIERRLLLALATGESFSRLRERQQERD
jgi:cobalt-zinc-cadmium efflux system outer membrane protein